MKNKIVVESQEILELGISTKAFKPEDVILVDESMISGNVLGNPPMEGVEVSFCGRRIMSLILLQRKPRL